MSGPVDDTEPRIELGVVRRLVASQFPQWSGPEIAPVDVGGVDNVTFRLGGDKSIRMPSGAGYVPAVAKEARWLPRLAPSLPLAVPRILGDGVPGHGYPFPWSVRSWIPGQRADLAAIRDERQFAVSLGEFLVALQACPWDPLGQRQRLVRDTTGGPRAGAHSWFRGASPRHYDAQTRRCLDQLAGRVDVDAVTEVWEAAVEDTWRGDDVWFHGDVWAGNLLVEDGELSAVIDFGTSGVGDPACDLVIAWTMFAEDARTAFRDTVARDRDTWARARGWALWKALLGLAGPESDPGTEALNERIVAELVEEHAAYR